MTKTILAEDDTLLAVVDTFKPSEEDEGIKFLTPLWCSTQLGVMRRVAGHVVVPHRHKQKVHTPLFGRTKEVLFVRRGCLVIDVFDNDRAFVDTVTLESGDVILLLDGYHGITFVKETDVVEAKDGPYAGEDKEWL